NLDYGKRSFFKFAGLGFAAATTGGLSACATLANNSENNSNSQLPRQPVFVPRGKNRFEEELKIWGVMPLQIKVSGKDTGGENFIFEHFKMGNGGPPRHFHYEQDEWFYVIEGEFTFEVGEEKFLLKPGDSLFAPRMVPHVWANAGKQVGTLLLSVQPAGSLEEFFMKTCQKTQLPSPEEVALLFADHGMKVVGPPLPIG